MQVRSLKRTNTILSLNTQINNKTVQKVGKPTKLATQDSNHSEVNTPSNANIFQFHPAYKYLRGTCTTEAEFLKFANLLYKGLYYSTNNLKGPSKEYLEKKKVKLTDISNKKKMLIMDLDETMIHSVFTKESAEVEFEHRGDNFKFNVRPYCLEFLSNMAQHYNIYVFTAGTKDYAEPIISYLNKHHKTILGVLHRKNCMETQNGFFIKDLRIISDVELKDIVMIDNLVHSFGLQITNGIPILDFTNNKHDQQLKGLQPLLIKLSKAQDVRTMIESEVGLKECLQWSEEQFSNIENKGKS